ncbi:MAG TPA: carboxypeptidase regulatory-like domain-containing protein [Candidatus Angelobacter sp.]
MPGFPLFRYLTLVVFILGLGSVKAALSQSTPPLGHIVIVALENHSYSDVVGSSSMPYLNSLINQYGLAQNFIANVHGSFPDYAMLTTGELITAAGSGLPNDFPISIDNLVRELNAAGKTWKVYAESIPSTGYTGADSYPYVKTHNPFAYMTDVLNSSTQANNIVPFSQFASDLAANALPNFAFVIPNQEDDAHDCPGGGTSCSDATILSTADQWLQTNIAPLLSNGAFQQNGLLVIWWDEGNGSDTNAGGKVAITMVGPTIKPGYRSTTTYHHENLLRTIAEGLGLGFPGASVYVQSMGEFFGPNTTPGSITGHVTDASTGAALSGATVSYSGGSTTTDSNGNYTLSNVAAGTYSVTAAHSGYGSVTSSVTVTAATSSTLNFQLTATSSPGAITGHVNDSSTGAALSGATVSYSGGSTTTDSSGNYAFANVNPGPYSLTASHSGYNSQTSSVTVASGTTATLNFQLTAASASPGAITGKVTNVSNPGETIASTTVSYSGGSTTTDSNGNYTLGNVAPGTYNVTASHTGWFSQTKSVTVTSGATSTLNFALATGGKVGGTVTNSSGSPISGTAVTITGGNISTTVNTTTNSTGGYNSNWVPVGPYTVTVSATGFTTQSQATTVTTGNTTTLNFTMH